MTSSAFPSFWQRAWDEAQPHLQQQLAGSPGTLATISERVNRVGQLDAEVLDSELVQLIQEPINKALSLVNPTFRSKLEPELLLLIRIILHKFSLWDLGATYGAKLQDLRYVSATECTRQWIAKGGLPVRALLGHAFLTILTPYLHTRFRAYALSNGWPDAPSRDYRRRLWRLLNKVESTYSLLSLMNFVVFLSNGRYRTVADRLLALRLTPSRPLTNRGVSYEFMNRQMTWHAFTEFLLLVLPLFNSRTFRRTYKQALARVKSVSISSRSLLSKDSVQETRRQSQGPFFALSPDQCAICAVNAKYNFNSSAADIFRADATLASGQLEAESHDFASDGPPKYPITIPYRGSCGDIYCYCCITERLVRSVDDGENGWPCLRCGETMKECKRLSAIADDDESSSRTSFSLSDDDLSSFDDDT